MIELGTITNVLGNDVTLDTKLTEGLDVGNYAAGMEVSVLVEVAVTGGEIKVPAGAGLGHPNSDADIDANLLDALNTPHVQVQASITLPDANGSTTTVTFSGAQTGDADAASGRFDSQADSVASLKTCFDASALSTLGAATIGTDAGKDVLQIVPEFIVYSATDVVDDTLYTIQLTNNKNSGTVVVQHDFAVGASGNAATTTVTSIDNSNAGSVLTVADATNLNNGEKIFKNWTGAHGTAAEQSRKRLLGYI